MSDFENRAIGWDEEFTADEQEFKPLPDGDYDFQVQNFERSNYEGSEKLPPCMKVAVTLSCTDGVNTGKVIENFYLSKSSEWKIGSFLRAVGLKEKGAPTRPSLIGQSIGLTGRCKIASRKWTGNNGQENTSNMIKEFYPKAVNPMAGFSPAPSATPPAQFTQPQQPVYQQQNFVAPNPNMWQGR